MKYEKGLFLKYLDFLRPYWKGTVVLACLTIINSVIYLPIPIIIKNILDKAIPRKDFRLLIIFILGICFINIFKKIFEISHNILSNKLNQSVLLDMQVHLFKHLQTLPIDFFNQNSTGYLLSRMTNDTGRVQGFMFATIITLMQSILTLIFGVIALGLINLKILLVVSIIVPIYSFLSVSFRKKLFEINSQETEYTANYYSVLQDSLSGIRLSKLMCSEKYEEKKIKKLLLDLKNISIKRVKVSSRIFAFTDFVSSCCPLLIFLIGGLLIITSKLTIGELISANFYAAYIFGPVDTLARTNMNWQKSAASAYRIFELLQKKPEEDNGTKSFFVPIEGIINFENVSFSYNADKEAKIIKNMSFKIEEKKTTALFGPSGSGKSTIISLISRFYIPQEGKIRIDSIDINDVPLNQLRKIVCIIPQEVFLFNTTILENIAYGSPEVNLNEAIEASKAAYIHDFIENLPNGYFTLVGERGIKLSGGQRQRIAIARAIIKNSPILILDEATSSLDSESEYYINRALKKIKNNRTIIVIAHRLSSIINADDIIFIENGRIMGIGNHKDLFLYNSRYRHFTKSQFNLNDQNFIAEEKTFEIER